MINQVDNEIREQIQNIRIAYKQVQLMINEQAERLANLVFEQKKLREDFSNLGMNPNELENQNE